MVDRDRDYGDQSFVPSAELLNGIIERFRKDPQLAAAFGYEGDSYKLLINRTFFQIEGESVEKDREVVKEILEKISYDPQEDYGELSYCDARIINLRTGEHTLEMVSSPNSFYVGSLDNRFGFEAHVGNIKEKSASMSLAVTLVRQENGSTNRHPLLPRYGELVELSIDYFQRQGFEIVALYGSWLESWQGGENVNYKVYKQAVEQGLSREEAAFRTPTGKIAKRLGFEQIFFDDNQYENGENNAKGVAALFTKLDSGIRGWTTR